MKETIKMGLSLMITTLIAGAVLALTNYYTYPIIIKQRENIISSSLREIIDADSFKENQNYYEAYKGKNLVGRVLKVSAKGYSSTIYALVGIDRNNKITGIKIISQAETPGLGAKIEEKDFLNQFIGKTENQIKIKKDGGEIDAITGATISSSSITNAIRESIKRFNIKDRTSKKVMAKVYVKNEYMKNVKNETNQTP